MEITEVQIKLHESDKLRAFASLTLSNAIVVRGIKIIEGSHRTFVAMPARSGPEGRQSDICHPLDQRTRTWIEETILTEYRKVLSGEPVGAASDRSGTP